MVAWAHLDMDTVLEVALSLVREWHLLVEVACLPMVAWAHLDMDTVLEVALSLVREWHLLVEVACLPMVAWAHLVMDTVLEVDLPLVRVWPLLVDLMALELLAPAIISQVLLSLDEKWFPTRAMAQVRWFQVLLDHHHIQYMVPLQDVNTLVHLACNFSPPLQELAAFKEDLGVGKP